MLRLELASAGRVHYVARKVDGAALIPLHTVVKKGTLETNGTSPAASYGSGVVRGKASGAAGPDAGGGFEITEILTGLEPDASYEVKRAEAACLFPRYLRPAAA